MKYRLPGFGREMKRMAIRAAAAGCVHLAQRAPRPQPVVRAAGAVSQLLKELRREIGRASRRIESRAAVNED